MIIEMTVYCPNNINGEEETVTKKFQDWRYEGKVVETAKKVGEDYFYDYFDKHYYKITNIEELW